MNISTQFSKYLFSACTFNTKTISEITCGTYVISKNEQNGFVSVGIERDSCGDGHSWGSQGLLAWCFPR